MLPEYIQQGLNTDRIPQYQVNLDLFNGDHYKIFNTNEQEAKVHAYEYICYGILNQAVKIKTDLIWKEKPIITFTSKTTQKAFDELRESTNFDYAQQQVTAYQYVLGDCLTKISIDNNNLTANEEDLEIKLYLQTPQNWFPDYDPYSPMRNAISDSLLFKKEIYEDNVLEGYAYLLETHKPGQILYTAFFEKTDNKGKQEAEQVPVLRYFELELSGVVADGQVTNESLEIIYNTNCEYSLLQRFKGATQIDSYFGKSNFSMPVRSKINALNNYANLADVIIVTNAFPKLILSENASNMLKRIIEEYNYNRTNTINENENGKPVFDDDIDYTQTPGKTFLSNQSYATSYAFRKLVNEMRAFEDGSKGGQTKYLTNEFSLEEIRQQHKIFFNALMSELDIAEVFYNPELSTGALSGVAYKRLMTTTLNAVEVTKRQLEGYLKRVVYTMLELANKNGLIKAKPEMPTITFQDGLVNDETEELQNLVTKIQNKLIPLSKAIAIANDVSEDEANDYLDEIDLEAQFANNGQIQSVQPNQDSQAEPEEIDDEPLNEGEEAVA